MNDFEGLNMSYLVRGDFVSPLVGIAFLLVFLLLVFITYNFRLYVKMILFSILNISKINDKDELESNKNRKAGFWLIVFFLVVVSLILHNFISKTSFFFNSKNESLYMIISFGIVFLFFLLKIFLKKVLGEIFSKQNLTIILYNHMSCKDKGLGLLLFPLLLLYNFCLPLKDMALMLFIIISCTYLFLRWLNGFLIGIKYGNIPYFYSFLYICTLEIIPFVLVLRLISKLVPSILA